MPRGGFRPRAGRPARRIKVEQLRSIDVRQFAREGVLEPGSWRWSWWDADTGATTFSLVLRARHDHVALEYSAGSQLLSEPIGLAHTPCHLGGVRTWFACPGCGRRVAILYLLRGFRCRDCHGLAYTSQSSEADAARARVNALRDRLGPACSRPKRMGQATYERLLIDLARAERRVSVLFSRWARVRSVEM